MSDSPKQPQLDGPEENEPNFRAVSVIRWLRRPTYIMDWSGANAGPRQSPEEPNPQCSFCLGLCRLDCPNFRSLSPVACLLKAAEIIEALESANEAAAEAPLPTACRSIDEHQAEAPDKNNKPSSDARAQPQPNMDVMPRSSKASQPNLDALKKTRQE